MSEVKWNKGSIKPQLDTIQLKDKIKVLMPDPVLNKIKYLCRSIPQHEWSGVLFYSIKGSIRDPKKMSITLEDILPMDKGSQAATDFNMDSRFMEFIMEDPKRTQWKTGLIHSHNTMSVFFSGTDMSELNDNAPSHNFYLSLIVNNYMDFLAKVAFVGTMEQDVEKLSYMALDEQGNPYPVEVQNFKIKKEKLYLYDCEIKSKVETITVGKSFAERVTGIIEAAKQKAMEYTKSLTHYPKGNGWDRHGYENPKTPIKPNYKDLFDQYGSDMMEEGVGDEVLDPGSEDYGFALSLLSLGSRDKETLEEVLDEYIAMNISGRDLADSVLGNYAKVYEAYWHLQEDDMDIFLSRGEDVTAVLGELEAVYPIVTQTIEAIIRMLTKFEEYGTAV